MTKTQSLLNAAIVANAFTEKFTYGFDVLEELAVKLLRNKYDRVDTTTWNDSAGNSIFVRVGDYHAVSYWDGEDMIFIYEVGKDEDLCESLSEREPIFSEQI
tara:strand:- start:335 stop:640 length:306 start_codon:yes stop_codon:yes gene_type:complete